MGNGNQQGKRKMKPSSWHYQETRKREVPSISVSPGQIGYLFTCDGFEKNAVREAHNLLNSFINNDGPETTKETAYEDDEEKSDKGDGEYGKCNQRDDEDISDTLKRECSEIRRSRKNKLLMQQPTGVKNCIFLASKNGEDSYSVAHSIVEDVLESGRGRCRFLQRIIPVEIVCKNWLTDIDKAIGEIVSRHFVKSESPQSFAVMYKTRNKNDTFTRDKAIDMVTDAMQAVSPTSSVNLDNPDKAIIIEVLRNSVCLAVIKDYMKFRRYNLHPQTKIEEKQKNDQEMGINLMNN